MNWMKKWNLYEKGIDRTAAQLLTAVWSFVLVTVFPLYMKNRYSRLGVHKYSFFLYLSLACLLPAAALYGWYVLRRLYVRVRQEKLRRPAVRPDGWSVLDTAMLVYLAAAFLSWACSVDRIRAWTGAEGWSMGLRSQLLFVLSYFLVSRLFSFRKVVLTGHFLGSGAVFALGLLHRFGVDPLGLYEGIDASYRLLFLSTVGQASWYSSYVCIALVPGVTLFFLSRKPLVRLAAGAHCALGFATVVTQNSDSAYAAMAFLLFGAFLAACDSPDRMEHFWELALLMLGSFKAVGVFQVLFADRAVKLGGLSEFLSQSRQTWFLFFLLCLGYTVFLYGRRRWQRAWHGERMRALAVGMLAALLTGYVLFVWLNTTGRLQDWFGVSSQNPYLFFDKYWGNSRGFTWTFAADTIRDFSPVRKLFGVGCDCFFAYCYGNAELQAYLNHFFGQNQVLTNAHNEFLNMLFCMGAAGFLAYAALFAAAFRRFLGAREKTPLAFAGALAVLVYGAHNFFCYQQVCCAPYLFLILGAAENLVRMNQKSERGT